MTVMIVFITEILKGESLNSRESGGIVFDVINRNIRSNQKVTLSFKDVEMCSSAFINACIGKLYFSGDVDTVDGLLSIADVDNTELHKKITRSISDAKDFEFHEGLVDDALLAL